MASKKKTQTAPKVKTPKTVKSDNNSLMMLALACGVMIASYFLFSNLATGRSSMGNQAVLPVGKPVMMANNEVTLQLNEQNNSSEYGNAVITEVNGKAKVHIEIKNAPRGVAQPAHIHVGSCIDLGDVKYPLTNVVNGVSDTTLNVSLSDLRTQGSLALNIHKSVSQSKIYVSCGNL